MAFNPLAHISPGVSDTTPVNALIDTLNKLLSGFGQSVTALATDQLQPSTSLADIPGASVSVTVAGSNAIALAVGAAAIQIGTTEAGHNIAVDLDVDGAVQAGQIIWPTGLLTPFATPARSWIVPLSAGTHTLKLRGRNDGTSDASRIIRSGETGLSVLLIDIA